MSSSCTNWSRGSKPRTIGTAGSENIRVKPVSTSGPSTLAQRSDRDGRLRALFGELRDRRLRLPDVALQRRAGRMRAAHLLGEEGRVVAVRSVVERAGLEDELPHRRILARAGGEDVHRPDHVVLVGGARGHPERVDDEPGVDDGVDLGRADDPLDQGVLVRDLHELGALELAARLAAVDPDDRLDLLEALERLGQPPTPVRGEAGDQDAPRRGVAGNGLGQLRHPNHTDLRLPTISCRSSWMRARTSWATVCTSALSWAASRPPSSTVSIGSRNRILNLAGR